MVFFPVFSFVAQKNDTQTTVAKMERKPFFHFFHISLLAGVLPNWPQACSLSGSGWRSPGNSHYECGASPERGCVRRTSRSAVKRLQGKSNSTSLFVTNDFKYRGSTSGKLKGKLNLLLAIFALLALGWIWWRAGQEGQNTD